MRLAVVGLLALAAGCASYTHEKGVGVLNAVSEVTLAVDDQLAVAYEKRSEKAMEDSNSLDEFFDKMANYDLAVMALAHVKLSIEVAFGFVQAGNADGFLVQLGCVADATSRLLVALDNINFPLSKQAKGALDLLQPFVGECR